MHLGEHTLHISDELKLIARAVEVLTRPVCSEIGVAVKIVGEEAHTALVGHHYSTYWQKLIFGFGKTALYALKKALYIKLVEADVKIDL